MSEYRYKRILLKLSGEAVAGPKEIIDFEMMAKIADTLIKLNKDGVQVGVIFGAGNIWRGRSGGKMDRVTADRMGMLATVINSLACKDAVLQAGGKCRVMSSTPMEPYAEVYSTDTARRLLDEGNIVIFAGGSGCPYFSTDTAGILRAAEIGADVFLLGKNCDGIYDKDPGKNPDAVRFDSISYLEVVRRNLKAIDLTAAAFGADFGPEAFVFKLRDIEDIIKACKGECSGTVVTMN